VLGFDHRPSVSCRICGQSQHPENLVDLAVPLSRQSLQLCLACRADYECSGRSLSEFNAPSPPERPFPWPGPTPADLESSSDSARGALEAHLEVRLARPHPAVEGSLSPEELGRLVEAWEAWDNGLPYYDLSTPEHARGVVLFSLLTLELGSRAPKLYGRKGGPSEWLKSLADQARAQPGLRDPRLPWARAVLAYQEGNLAGVDRDLALALEWLEACEDAERWAPVAAGLHYARALRARARSLWGGERDALKAYCRAAPQDELGFLELAQAQIRCARPEVAREILAARVGSADATPAAVAREVAAELGALRPRLAELHAGTPQAASPALAYTACLLALGEFDEAWRVVSGAEWLAQVEPSGWTPAQESSGADSEHEPCDLDPEVRPYLELAARAALGRGQRARALTLLQAVHDLALAAEGDEPRARRDLLAVLQEEVTERLDALDLATAERSQELAILAGEISKLEGAAQLEALEELGQGQDAIRQRLLGDEEGSAQFGEGGGLRSLVALLRRHQPALATELREPVARRALDWFLGREFGARFEPLVEPPSPLDSSRVRLADGRYRTHLAYRALARRQLPEALAHDHQARDAVGFGAPFRPLLTYLGLIRRGGPTLRVWATARWLETLAGPGRGDLPFEVGLLPVTEEELEAGDLDRFGLLLRSDDPERPSEWPPLPRLSGRCQLLFPSEGPPEGLPKVPRVRAYVQRLLTSHPGLPLLLDWSVDSGMFRLVLGCLASPDALTLEAPGLNAADESVLASLTSLVAGFQRAAKELDLDSASTLSALLEHLAPELRARFLPE